MAWQATNQQYPRPRDGWIKTIREALKMTAEQLGNRMGVSRGRIVQLEKAEVEDAVTLRSLREAASAMECELVYAIVPKGDDALEDIIERQARRIIRERLSAVAHSMALEGQDIDQAVIAQWQETLVEELAEKINKKLWDPIKEPPAQQNELAIQIARLLEKPESSRKK